MSERYISLCHSKREREKWLSLRPNGFGGSDIGTLLGLKPMVAAHNVAKYREQAIRDKALGTKSFTGNAACWWGDSMADPVARMWQQRRLEHPQNFYKDTTAEEWEEMLMMPEHPFFYVTPDWRTNDPVTGEVIPVEVKCTDSEVFAKYWKDGPPKHVKAQAILQAYVVGAPYCIVVQCRWGAYPNEYKVECTQASVDYILPRLKDCWDMVLALRAVHDVFPATKESA